MVESLERVAGGRVAGLGRLAGKGGREVTKEQPLAGKAGRGQELLLQQQLALKIRKRAPSQALFPEHPIRMVAGRPFARNYGRGG